MIVVCTQLSVRYASTAAQVALLAMPGEKLRSSTGNKSCVCSAQILKLKTSGIFQLLYLVMMFLKLNNFTLRFMYHLRLQELTHSFTYQGHSHALYMDGSHSAAHRHGLNCFLVGAWVTGFLPGFLDQCSLVLDGVHVVLACTPLKPCC
jgi:hypothetical protein